MLHRILFVMTCLATLTFFAIGCRSDRRGSGGESRGIQKPRVDPEPAIAVVIYGGDFDHDPTTEEVLEEAERRGLERPTYTEASKLGENHEKHSGWRTDNRFLIAVFFHQPEIDVSGTSCVLGLVCVDTFCGFGILPCDDVHWPRDAVFVFMRRPKR